MGCKIYLSRKGFLVYRLQWNNQRSWEGTTLRDTPANRKRVEADADLMSREMTVGRFDYARWFPAGNKIPRQQEATRKGWTVREYYDKWILQQRPPLVRKSNERAYKQHFTRYILPRVGEVNLGELTTRALMDFQSYLLHDVPRLKKGATPGLSVKTVRNIVDGSFRAMVRDAREVDGLITSDPFAAIQWPDKETERRDAFTKEDRDKIIDYFRSNEPFYYPFVFTMFWSRMRPS